MDGGLNPIAAENALPGDRSWKIDPAYLSQDTSAYASPQGIRSGEATPSASPRPTARSDTCDTDLETGLIECDWPDTFTFTDTSGWLTGVWLSDLGSHAPVPIATPYPILGITHGGGQFYLLGHQSVASLVLDPVPQVNDLCPIAGTGRGGSSWGNGTDLPLPCGLAAGPAGSLLVADPINRRVLQLSSP